jgi:hypothetical protein
LSDEPRGDHQNPVIDSDQRVLSHSDLRMLFNRIIGLTTPLEIRTEGVNSVSQERKEVERNYP